MPWVRATLWGLAVGLGSLLAAARADALTACTAAQIVAQDAANCPSGTGPCTIKKDFDVPAGCTLDFGARDVTLANLAVLDTGPGIVTIRARNFTVAAGGFINGRGTATTAPGNVGSTIRIQTTGNVAVLRTTQTGRIEVSANATTGSIEIAAGGSVTVQGLLEADSLDTADGGFIDVNAGTDIVSIGGSEISANGLGLGSGGSVTLTAGGTVNLGDSVDLDGYDGGSFDVTAAGEVRLADITLRGSGFGSSTVTEPGFGGTVSVDAGTNVALLGVINATGTSGGDGGTIDVVADYGTVTISAPVRAEAGLPEPLETGAGGGDISIYAAGALTVQSSGSVSARSDGGLGFGGVIALDTTSDLTVAGVVDASGGSEGGTIDGVVDGNGTLSGSLLANARNPGGFGGTVDIAAGRIGQNTLSVGGLIDVSGGGCSPETGCGIGGTTTLEACTLTIAAAGRLDARGPDGGGTHQLTVHEQLSVAGRIDAGATDPAGTDGITELFFRSARPPVVTGVIDPPPTLQGRPTCTGGSDPPACMAPCPTCGNGVVEYPEQCDNSVGTPADCDGCSRFCLLQSCNDNNGCTVDSCTVPLGCRHTFQLPCNTPTPTVPAGPSPTPTPSPTATVAGPSPTATIALPTSTPSHTPIPSPTPTFTATPTVTPTATPSATPTITPTRTPTATPTVTPTPTRSATPTPTPTATTAVSGSPTPARLDDSVVLPVRSVSLVIPTGQASARKQVKIKVLNGDVLPSPEPDGHPVRLVVHPGTCPAGIVVDGPDFDPQAPGSQDRVLLRGGRSKKAILTVQARSADFTSFNRITPTRCTLLLEARTDLPGSGDPAPANNFAPLEINVIDRNDPDLAQLHESVIDSAAAASVVLRDGRVTATRTTRPRLLNGNLTAVAPHAIAVTRTTDCPAGAIGVPDFDPRTLGEQHVGAVAPAARLAGSLAVTANAADVVARNKRSPYRCTVVLTALGPTGDTDPTNNVTTMVVDVYDANDY